MVGSNAFKSKSLRGVKIPSGVTSIGGSAFSSNSFGTITIKGNVTNPATRFDSSLASIGWGTATINRVTE